MASLEAPADIDTLCLDLGIGLKRRARLAEDHGDEFLPWLQEKWIWAKKQDTDNFLHENPGFGKADYTNNPGKAMRGEYGPEWAPPSDEISEYRDSRQAQARFQREYEEQVADLWAACEQVRLATSHLKPEVKKKIGREIWVLRSKIDALERKMKRQIAA